MHKGLQHRNPDSLIPSIQIALSYRPPLILESSIGFTKIIANSICANLTSRMTFL